MMNDRRALRVLALALSLVLFVDLSGSFISAQAQSTSPTQIRVAPARVDIPTGQAVEVIVEVVDVQALYGVDVALAFDPNVVEVVDSDPATDGAQVAQGAFLDAGFVVINRADNISGTVRFAMTQLNPSEPKSGSGALIVVKLRGKQEGASSPLTLTKVDMAQRNGAMLTGTLVSGQAQVVPASSVVATATPAAPAAGQVTVTQPPPPAAAAPAATETPAAPAAGRVTVTQPPPPATTAPAATQAPEAPAADQMTATRPPAPATTAPAAAQAPAAQAADQMTATQPPAPATAADQMTATQPPAPATAAPAATQAPDPAASDQMTSTQVPASATAAPAATQAPAPATAAPQPQTPSAAPVPKPAGAPDAVLVLAVLAALCGAAFIVLVIALVVFLVLPRRR